MAKYMILAFLAIFAVSLNAEFIEQKGGKLPAGEDCFPQLTIPPPEGAGKVSFDNHGNFWTISPTEKKGQQQVMVLPAQNQTAWVKEELGGIKPANWQWIVADEFGFIWTSDGNRVMRLDPKIPVWQEISADSAFPDDQITAMGIAPNGSAMVAFKKGKIAILDRNRPYKKRKDSNSIIIIEAPGDIKELLTDDEGNIWAKARGKVYMQTAADDAWQKNWQLVARMPSGSHDLSGDVLNGKFYMDWALTGDYGYPSTGNFHRKLLEFDPKANKWNIVADYGFPRCYCAVAHLDDKIWTIAGAALDKEGKRYNPTISQIFDPATGVMSKGLDIPIPLPAAIGLNSGGRLYVLGFPQVQKEEELQLYSIGKGEDKWKEELKGPKGGGASYGIALDGKLYTVVAHKYIAIFDTKSGKWKTTEAPHSPRSPAVGHYNGEIWVMGGRTKEGGSVTYIYNPEKDEWRKGPDLPRELVWGCAFNIDGKMYLTGGHGARCYNNRTFMLKNEKGK